MAVHKPAAFLSYVHFDDEHDAGKITEFRKRLSAEVHVQTGREFTIFQDKNIEWGENWKKRIKKSLNSATFLIPVITPNFFSSDACLEELEIFLKREARLKRDDLILPVYYVECPILGNENKGTRRKDRLARIISTRQYFDWRELRFESLTSAQVTRTLAQLAIFIRSALARDNDKQGSPRSRSAPKVKKARTKPSSTEQITNQLLTKADNEQLAASAITVHSSNIGTEVNTLIVDQLGRGDYTSVREAIEAAKPGTLILLRRGIYKEAIVVDKSIEIVGDGPLGEVELRVSGNDAIVLKTSMARIANLKINHEANGDSSALVTGQGRADIEGCDISSDSTYATVFVAGGDPRFRRNRVHGSSKIGISVVGGDGSFEENEVCNQGAYGLCVVGGTIRITRNRIHSSRQGVLVGASCALEDNEIFENRMGITNFQTASPIIRRNRIHANEMAGIWDYDQSQASIEDNEIFGNGYHGVYINGEARPILRANRIYDNKACGVKMKDRAVVTLEDNLITNNVESGLEIVGSARANARDNKVAENKVGVRVDENGGGNFARNKLTGNLDSAWDISESGKGNVNRKDNTE